MMVSIVARRADWGANLSEGESRSNPSIIARRDAGRPARSVRPRADRGPDQ